MSPKQLLAGLLFVAPFTDWSPGLLLNVLLLLVFSWWLRAPVTEGNTDQLDHRPDRGDQALSETTEELVEEGQPHDHVDVLDGREQNSIVLDPGLRQSLRKVFDCSYSQFILLWYNPPEPRDDQPLYQVLFHEFTSAVDHAVLKIRNLDLTRIEIGLIQTLAKHLKSAKKGKEREKMFQTRQEEVFFLRKAAETLMWNLVPDSLWKLNTYQQLLKEVIALKVLEEVINMVCDPDFINQTLIKFLDKDSGETKEVKDIENPPQKTGASNEIKNCNIPKENKKKKSYRKAFNSKLSKIFKRSKKKGAETSSSFGHTDEVDGESCSELEAVDQNFRSFSTDVEDITEDSVDDSAEEEDIKFADEMLEWLKENLLITTENEESSLRNCKITISMVLWNEIENPTCVIDVENVQVAEECWSIKREYHEFEELQNELSKTFDTLVETKLPSINCVKPDTIDDKFKEAIECQLNGFLKKLVTEESILHNESTRKFFSANDELREYWGLLKSLFNEDDEVICAASDTSEDPCNTDVGEDEPLETDPENTDISNHKSVESLPSKILSEDSESDCGFRLLSGTSKKKVAGGFSISCRKRINGLSWGKIPQTSEQTECLTNEVQKLLEELFCTDDYFLNKLFLRAALNFLRTYKRKYIQKRLDQFFSKEQMVLYVDCLRETLWPNGKPAGPPPVRSLEEKTSAKERAEELLQEKVSALKIPSAFFPFKEIMQRLLPIFQDVEINKRLVYITCLWIYTSVHGFEHIIRAGATAVT
ncbi:sorting nexin-25 isoform X2 [Chiloscyllium plagiosum]|uniref:sorting nexin-25 isoform X2 n=1 Tax=Chiloscyllium plagiosum TaxID=36176 RepID=UPI001CB7B0D2|nr:sorting nexin-25 isoform X2 [Chiloscyllium plagiosum]